MKYTYPFNYNFDYDLLLEDSKALSKYQVRHARTGLGKGYRKAEKGEEITHWASKIHLLLDKNVADNPNKISIVNQCKKLMNAIGSNDYDIILVEYDSESWLDWHIDSGPTQTEDYGRINIVVTDNWESTPIIFKGDNREDVPCPAKLQVANSYRIDHRYDNRGRADKRILLIMTTKDLNYDEVIERVKCL